MNQTRGMTFRLDPELIRALKVRGAQNDRSANKELSVILKAVLKTEKAPGHVAKQSPDASTSE